MIMRNLCKVLGFVLLAYLSGWVPTDMNVTQAEAKTRKISPRSPGVSTRSKREEGDYVVEKRSDGTTVKYKRKNQYDFEGANVDGLYKKPTGAYISNIKEVRGRTIIRIRENFDAEVDDSARLLK